IGKSRRIGTKSGSHNRRARPLSPDLELLNGSRTESITRRQHDGKAPLSELCCQLANCRGLAGTIDPDHENDMRLYRKVELQRLCHWRKYLLDLFGHHSLHLGTRDVLA